MIAQRKYATWRCSELWDRDAEMGAITLRGPGLGSGTAASWCCVIRPGLEGPVLRLAGRLAAEAWF
jgi:hypothetical protein